MTSRLLLVCIARHFGALFRSDALEGNQSFQLWSEAAKVERCRESRRARPGWSGHLREAVFSTANSNRNLQCATPKCQHLTLVKPETVVAMFVHKEMKPYWIAVFAFGLAFAVLFSARLGIIGGIESPSPAKLPEDARAVPDRDDWMKIVQNDRKIGYAHTVFFRTKKGFKIEEALFMRLNTMGVTQDIRLNTEAELFDDLSLSSFAFRIYSGPFDFKAEGHVFGKRLHVRTESGGETSGLKIRIEEKPYIAAGIVEAILASGLTLGEKMDFQIFDPAVMANRRITVTAEGRESVVAMGSEFDATKISMEFNGIRQTAWIGENGELLRQEGGLGIAMEKTIQSDAVSGVSFAEGEDLTAAVSIKSNLEFKAPEKPSFAEYEIGGVEESFLRGVHGGRQHFENGVLRITKEKIGGQSKEIPERDAAFPSKYLKPGPFIQSDSSQIKAVIGQIVRNDDLPLEKVKKIMAWIRDNIDRRPVLSLPDALSTLRNKAGDCNEHSVLTAALCRAAGVPARVEAGVAYVNGAFYYHAWNQVYVGEWVTVDSLFGQLPADVTHIRFARETQEEQVNILGLLGKLKIKVLKTSGESGNGS